MVGIVADALLSDREHSKVGSGRQRIVVRRVVVSEDENLNVGVEGLYSRRIMLWSAGILLGALGHVSPSRRPNYSRMEGTLPT